MENNAFTPDEAIAKYLTERIPRYTSYPTAPHFNAEVDAGVYASWLRALPTEARLSLYIHVPFCRTLCWYCGCHTAITRHREPIELYARVLEREIEMVGELAGGRHAAHLHFGGGTPATLGPELFRKTMAALRARFDFEAGAEVAIEIDPRRLDAEMAGALAEGGVTRASLGVQSFDPEVQKAVNRIQSQDVTRVCVDRLRAAGIQAINIDLLYGLPYETAESCKATLEGVLSMNPSRFAVFGYAHVPSMMKHQQVIKTDWLPDAAERLRQETTIGETLVKAGYMRIGLDHYAKPSDPMAQAWMDGRLRRNFQGYTDDPADALIGMGVSSIGQLPQGYVQNTADLKLWRDTIESGQLATSRGRAFAGQDLMRAAIIERLMCDLRVDLAAVLEQFALPADALGAELEALKSLEVDGLVRVDRGMVTVPETMRNLVRKVASVFDSYLDPAAGRHAVAV